MAIPFHSIPVPLTAIELAHDDGGGAPVFPLHSICHFFRIPVFYEQLRVNKIRVSG
jgi:hypothetical protein